MKRVWQTAAKLLAGITLAAICATPQGYTISARPGALNYIEGNAYINGGPVSSKGLRSTFLNANDTLSTDIGKAEVLLTPGVFLRIGNNSAVRMVSPSLTDTQVEVKRGEAMLEVAGLAKDNNIEILERNGAIRIQKDGLYRFSADDPPTAGVLEGKAEVSFDGQKVRLGKGHQTVVAQGLKAEKFDLTRSDDLYAWSNVRSQYDAASSYQAAKSVPINSSGGWWGYGNSGFYSPGWFWNGAFDSWAWLPAYGSFYSPFGWGFYAPGVVGYAPVVYVPVNGGYGYTANLKPGTKPVPVNPARPPAAAAVASSPAAYAAARAQAAHSFASTGFTTANGAHVSAGRGASMASSSGGHAGGTGHASAPAAHSSAGGFSGGGGHASAAGAGGHASGGGGGHR